MPFLNFVQFVCEEMMALGALSMHKHSFVICRDQGVDTGKKGSSWLWVQKGVPKKAIGKGAKRTGKKQNSAA